MRIPDETTPLVVKSLDIVTANTGTVANHSTNDTGLDASGGTQNSVPTTSSIFPNIFTTTSTTTSHHVHRRPRSHSHGAGSTSSTTTTAHCFSEIVADVKDELMEVLQEDVITPIKPRDEGDHTYKLSAVALAVMVFYKVSGGPFGCEPTVRAAGPFYALVGFIVFPILWSIPEAFITAELGSAYPEPSGRTYYCTSSFYLFWWERPKWTMLRMGTKLPHLFLSFRCLPPNIPPSCFNSRCVGRRSIRIQSVTTMWLLSLDIGCHRQCYISIVIFKILCLLHSFRSLFQY